MSTIYTRPTNTSKPASPEVSPDRQPWVLYVRKSTEADERQAQSLRNQEDVGRELAAQLGVEVIVVEDAHSAKEPGRPTFDGIIAMIDRGDVGGIIAWHPDRLSRNEIDAAAITFRLRKKVLPALAFVNYQFVNTHEGILMLQSALSQSQYQSAKLGDDVTRGMNAKRKLGWFPHRVMPGYLNNTLEVKGLKTISPDPERFPIIRRAFDYFLTGAYTQAQLRKIINDQWGYRSRKTLKQGGSPMSANTLSRILRSRFYLGECIERKYTYAGQHTPMITLEEHRRVLALLKRLERVQPKRHEFAYTGTLYCGACGRLFTAYEAVNRHGRTYIYYKCRLCRGEAIGEPALQEQLDGYAADIALPAPVFRQWAEEAIERYWREAAPKDEAVSSQRATSVVSIDTQLKNLLTALTTELISPEEFTTRRHELMAQREALAEESERRTTRRELAREAADNLLTFTANVQTWLHHPTPAVRRACARALGSNLRILDKKVLLDLHPLVVPLAECTTSLSAEYRQVELDVTLSESTKKQALEPVRVAWSRIWSFILTQAYEEDVNFPSLQTVVDADTGQSGAPNT